MSGFADQLRRQRLAAGLTQEGLAERAGLGVRTLPGLERGEHCPSRDTARRLAAGLGLDGDAAARFAAAGQPSPRARSPARRPDGVQDLATAAPAAGGGGRPRECRCPPPICLCRPRRWWGGSRIWRSCVPLFGTAAAIVTDTGGVLSHCAVVAREYGIPAVVGTGIATARLTDGQLVEVDGGAGLVRVLEGGGVSSPRGLTARRG